MSNKKLSLQEVHSSIQIPAKGFRKILAFAGPGMLIAVGYMDPGNWATDLAGGAKFGYTLLSVILISNIMAIFLQHLSLKLGIVANRDLAQMCRDRFHPSLNLPLWVLCELAIIATDIAEVIGAAIALNLLFSIPLTFGIMITGLDVLLILYLQNRSFRYIEMIVFSLIIVISGCFVYLVIVSNPPLKEMALGLIPSTRIVFDREMLYIAIGILGATVMPHNLYLHSAIVQTRKYQTSTQQKRQAVKYATWDSSISLGFAFFINAAILVVSAAVFHGTPYEYVADINDAYLLLSDLLGVGLASTFFAVALLASGQNSTLTATLAGQVVMEGFLDLTVVPWLRRLITRLLAIIPAMIVTILLGEKGSGSLLILSQVVLSFQLPFAVIPLVIFTSQKKNMGVFANSSSLVVISSLIVIIIVLLNLFLLYETYLFWIR